MSKKIVKATYVPQEQFDALYAAHAELNARFLELQKGAHKVREIAAKLIADAMTNRADPVLSFNDLQHIYIAVR